MKTDETKVLKFLRTKRNGVGVNELSRNVDLSKPILNKILKKLEKQNKITRSIFTRGKQSIVILTKFHQQDNFKKMKKIRHVIDENFDTPIIIKTVDGRCYAGVIDDYEQRAIYLFYPHRLKEKKWNKVNVKFEIMLGLEEIDTIYEANLENLGLEEISLEDTMKLWLNPNYIIKKGIYCQWPSNGKPHSKKCNVIIHESLVELYTAAKLGGKRDSKKLEKSLENLVLYFLEKGENIPYSNF